MQGATTLDTLVVTPAGNDGLGGPGYGSISGPGGSLAALTVGAADLRASTATVHVVLRAGLGFTDRGASRGGASEGRASGGGGALESCVGGSTM